MWLTDLADACRTSGLPVVEDRDWQTRGHGPMVDVQSIICHHTATSPAAAGDMPTLRVLREGHSNLPGPLSQLGLSRNGVVHVVAAGVCYHAGVTHQSWQGNYHAIGIEAEHPGGKTPWPQAQYDAYALLCAALSDHYDVPTSRVMGHKEIAKPAGRKSDPTFDMTVFRAAVGAPTTPKEDETMTPLQQARLENLLQLIAAQATRTGMDVQALRGQPSPKPVEVDEDAIAQIILGQLTPAAIAAAIPPDLASQVADELATRLTPKES